MRKVMEVVEPDPKERRRHKRAEVPAVAKVFAGERFLGVFAVSDLSEGGVALLGEALLVPGERVRLEIQLAGRSPLALAARVLRRQVSSPKTRRCALIFDHPPAEQVAALAAAVAVTEPGPAATVLVVWGRPSGGPALERELVSAGHRALLATTPLDAAAWLRGRGHTIAHALIDHGVARTDEWDFLQYLIDHHPHIRRLLLVDGVESFRMNFILRAGLAQAVLERPFSASAMVKKLGAGPHGVIPKRPRRKSAP
jgi:hypothetical protein